MIVQGRLELEWANTPPLVIVEPLQIPIEGIFPTIALIRIEPSARQSSQMTSQASLNVIPRADHAYVMLANFSTESLTIPKATVLGVAEEVSEALVDEKNEEKKKADMNGPVKPPRKKTSELLYDKLLHGKLDHLSQTERRQNEPVLLKYAHVFHDESTNDFKDTNSSTHRPRSFISERN
jgi:hypothetical protein